MNEANPIRFTCLSDCSNCCSTAGGFVYITEAEAREVAAFLTMDYQDFRQFFLRRIDDKTALVDREQDVCVFLEDGRCLIYAVRPQQCRTFPFWKENMQTPGQWEITKIICPGIGKGRVFSKREISEILNGKTLDSER